MDQNTRPTQYDWDEATREAQAAWEKFYRNYARQQPHNRWYYALALVLGLGGCFWLSPVLFLIVMVASMATLFSHDAKVQKRAEKAFLRHDREKGNLLGFGFDVS